MLTKQVDMWTNPPVKDQADQLLTGAGYPNGLKLKLMILQDNKDLATAIKSF
jgi:hypothetical protein